MIPTYERGALIGRALDSVLAQSRRADEVIVVDDGSADDTESVVAAYGDQVTYFWKPNGGVSSARNRAVAESRCDFVAFLDSDDLWYPDHLARIERAIAGTDGGAGLYFSDLDLVPATTEHPTTWQWSGFSIDADYELEEHAAAWACRDIQPMTTQASVVRRDAFLAVGGCALPCREDTHLFFKLALDRPVCAVAGVAGLRTEDSPTSIMRTSSTPNDPCFWRCTVRMYDDILSSADGQLAPDLRTKLMRRLAEGHFMLVRTSGATSPLAAARHLHRALRLDPAQVAGRVVRRLPRPGR